MSNDPDQNIKDAISRISWYCHEYFRIFPEGENSFYKLKVVKDHITSLTAQVEAWKESAAQFSRNTEYYTGLLDRIANCFGKESFISDDGSVQQDPLRAKMPELVEKLSAEVEQLRKDKERLDWLEGNQGKDTHWQRMHLSIMTGSMGHSYFEKHRQAIDSAMQRKEGE